MLVDFNVFASPGDEHARHPCNLTPAKTGGLLGCLNAAGTITGVPRHDAQPVA